MNQQPIQPALNIKTHLHTLPHLGRLVVLVLLSTLNPQLSTFAQGTAFTYQGSLHVNGGAASGSYDFRFRVASDALGNNYVGSPVLTAAVPANNSLFMVTLDFGAGIFTGGNLWLQVEVKTNGAAGYTTLTPLQSITPTPYAITAINANTASSLAGTLPAVQLSGTVPDARLAVNLARTNQVWLLGGNASTTPGTHFLGTTDDQSLELRVNGTRALRLEPNATSPNVIGGYVSNSVSPGFYGATIAGGGREGLVHTISAHHGTIGGGDRNTVSGQDGTIAGGGGNVVAGNYASVGGGLFNTIQPDAAYATIGGGYANTIQPSASGNDSYTTIAGGGLNEIQTNAFEATIGGGFQNTIQINSQRATIGGGYQNTIQANAPSATIGGGGTNTIQADGQYATIGGGAQNTIQGHANYATIPGGYLNSAASYAFAAGYRAKANHTGAFVWADSQDADFASTANNQFNIRAAGGVQLSTGTSLSFGSSLSPKINLYGTNFVLGIQSSVQYSRVGVGSGFAWYAGGAHNDNTFNSGGGTTLMTLTGSGLIVNGILASSSDRNMKENFASVRPREMLEKVVALPLSSWNYKADTATRHVGPMAQDFYAAFNVGPDDKHIATVDADGVALAAIQGLNQKVEDQGLELKHKRTEITELKARLEKLERRMNRGNEGAK
jgi:hypothetical protein